MTNKQDRKKVFAIKPERVCTGQLTDYHGRYCALGWAKKFGFCNEKYTYTYKSIAKQNGVSSTSVICINDSVLENRQDRAALINATLRKMGYDIPLAATVGKTILKNGYRRKGSK